MNFNLSASYTCLQTLVLSLSVGPLHLPNVCEVAERCVPNTSKQQQTFILLHEKFLQFDWLRAVIFQLNLKYLHVKITNLVRVVEV